MDVVQELIFQVIDMVS